MHNYRNTMIIIILIERKNLQIHLYKNYNSDFGFILFFICSICLCTDLLFTFSLCSCSLEICRQSPTAIAATVHTDIATAMHTFKNASQFIIIHVYNNILYTYFIYMYLFGKLSLLLLLPHSDLGKNLRRRLCTQRHVHVYYTPYCGNSGPVLW